MGAGRTRTLTLRIKSPLCCRYTTTPCEDVGAFESSKHLFSLLKSYEPKKVAWGGVEPPLPPYQSDVLPLHHRALSPSCLNQSGRSESNRLSRVPKTRGRPVPFIPSFGVPFEWPVWESNPSPRLERAVSSKPIDERAVVSSARTLSAVGREALCNS